MNTFLNERDLLLNLSNATLVCGFSFGNHCFLQNRVSFYHCLRYNIYIYLIKKGEPVLVQQAKTISICLIFDVLSVWFELYFVAHFFFTTIYLKTNAKERQESCKRYSIPSIELFPATHNCFNGYGLVVLNVQSRNQH
jgi:hypothetical protein